MNAAKFTSLLRHPAQLAELSYSHLEQLVDTYPFCLNLRLLLLKKSQQEQNPKLASHIRMVAAYSNDRSHFYRFFKAGGGQKQTLNPYRMAESFLEQNQGKSIPINLQNDPMPQASMQVLDEEEALQLNLSDPNLEDITHEINFSNFSDMEDDDSLEFNLDEHLKNFREEKEKTPTLPPLPSLGEKRDHVFFLEDLIKEDYPPSVEEAVVEEKNSEQPAEETVEDTLALEEPIEKEAEQEMEAMEMTEEEPKKQEEIAEPPSTNALDIPLEITNIPAEELPPPLPKPVPKTSFSSWLQQFQAPKPSVKKTVKAVVAAPKVVAPSPQVDPIFDLTKEPTPPPEKVDKNTPPPEKSKKVLSLDQLGHLSGEEDRVPKKSKKTKKKEKIRNFAAQSLNEDEEIASETLAIILAKQGAYPNAIRIYERLKLIYPEKSVFFASKIEELNKLI